MNQAGAHLSADDIHQLLIAIAQRIHSDARYPIRISFAFRVIERYALAARQNEIRPRRHRHAVLLIFLNHFFCY